MDEKIDLEIYKGQLPAPIERLESLLTQAGTSIIKAAFANSFFVKPTAARKRTPYFPDFARCSLKHHPGKKRGETTDWKGRAVKMDDNSRAQLAWKMYTGRPVVRRSGYGVRHIWGHPWDPDAYTAGWNLCYMPFWVGMLTEDQHPHADLQQAIKQASWDIFFAENPVCKPPAFVKSPYFDLASALCSQPIRLLGKTEMNSISDSAKRSESIVDIVREIRHERHQSWKNLQKAVRALMDLPHQPFGTKNVASSSKSAVRLMQKETGAPLHSLKDVLDSL